MIIGQNRCEELATPNVWRKINSTTQRVSYSTLLSGFVIVKHGPLMLACMRKLHVINLILSVRYPELGPCRGSNSVAQPLAQSAIYI